MKKKTLLWAVSLILMTTALWGCGQKEKNGDQAGLKAGENVDNIAAEKGGYVEKEMTLPSGVNASSIIGLDRSGEQPVLYTREEVQGMAAVKEYTYDGAGSWAETTPGWLSTVSIPYYEYGTYRVFTGEDENQYLYAVYANETQEEEEYTGHLYRSEDGETAQEITPASWLEKRQDYNYIESPIDVVVLQDGRIVAKFYFHVGIYRQDNGEKEQEITLDSMYEDRIYTKENQFMLLRASEMGVLQQIEVYSPGKTAPDKVYEMSEKSGTSGSLDILEDGGFLLATSDGFFKIEKDSETTGEVFISGLETSLSNKEFWCRGIKAAGDHYYALYSKTSGEGVLMEYVYDTELEKFTSAELTVYTVFQNPTLEQAAVLFHKENPNISIKVETMVSQEDFYKGKYDLEDIRKKMGADLMAGGGADIIVMDGLEAGSFKDKGVFADLGDVLNPLREQGLLLENVIQNYVEGDGKVYYVPLKFSLDLLVGREIDVNQVSDMKSLAKALETWEGSLLGVKTPGDLVAQFAPYFMEKIIDGKQLNKEVLAEYLGYLKAIGENGGIVQEYGDKTRRTAIWDISTLGKATIHTSKGFIDSMSPVSMANLVNGSYSSFENVFIPNTEIGVNSKSTNIETAKEFIAFALSEEVQDSDFYDGFPVNSKSLENHKSKDRSPYAMSLMMSGGDGDVQEFTVEPYEEKHAERLIQLCRQVSRPTVTDRKIIQELTEAMPAYLSGERSLEETVDIIDNGLRMYLAE